MYKRYPIQSFIDDRLKELGFWRGELVKRCGYINVSKGLRRLERLYSGDMTSSTSLNLLTKLPIVLELDEEKVIEAVSATNAQLDAEEAKRDADWRASFIPDAFILGTYSRPTHIWAFGLTGGVEQHLRIPLDTTESPGTFLNQALNFCKKMPEVRFFGPTTGFIINHTPDRAEQYDKDGNLINIIAKYYYPGKVTLTISGREIPISLLGKKQC